MQLEKAKLQVLRADDQSTPDGDPVDVQFNPATLRLSLTNETEGGEARGRQARQYTGASSTTLALDLVFDTADEGTTGSPRSVREKTAIVEQFIYPSGDSEENKQAPPRLRFIWGDLTYDGVLKSLTLDFDHFAANGFPLRAKASLTIEEQNPLYRQNAAGPGANRAGNTPLAGGFSLSAGLSLGVVGSIGLGVGLRAGVAIGGETAAGFAVRMGLDAEAWRGLSLGGGSPLSLTAGVEIGFDSNISASAGWGASAGANAGVSTSPAGAFGLQPETGVRSAPSAGANAVLQQQFAVAEAGGVGSAIESVKIVASTAAGNMARTAFALPAGVAPVVRPELPAQPRTPLGPAGSGSGTASAAPPPPRVDRRSASFGFGVPLRTAIGPALDRTAAGNAPVTADPSAPGWIALPVNTPVSAASGRTGSGKKRCGCGCSPCGHGR